MSNYYLGINLSHERSAAIVKDGEIVVAIEQERLDRQKYSLGFMLQAPGVTSRIQPPNEAIRYCLDSCGITLQDISSVTANMPGYDFAPDIMRNILPMEIADKVISIPSHHLAHAYSAYWPSGFDQALVLVVDATGTISQEHRTESYTLYEGHGHNLTTLHGETVAAHLSGLSTLGFLYEYVTRKAGFVTKLGNTNVSHAEAGKLMGLAPFGGEQVNFHPWIKPVENSYSLAISPYDIFLEIAALEKTYDTGEGKPYLRPYLVDLAYKIQDELEKALKHIVRVAMEQTGLKKLCIAGGVGLNSVANYKLFHDLGLDDIFIFPAASDSGIAAGAALWAYANQGGDKRPELTQATLGHAYGSFHLEQAIQQFDGLVEVEALTPAEMLERSAQALANGHIVARFEGGAEYGPRALGHRSIMADPTFQRMRDIINARVKFREAFRPFAPVIPLENVGEVFDLDAKSPFMLMVSPIKPEMRQQIPAVTHVDGTGRIQTVTAQDNPYFYQLCRRLVDLRQGPPVLLNTSFNVGGQPIVETPAEAIQTFLNTDIDYLALENTWISKRHVQVQNYEEHLSKVGDTAIPQGLPPGQPAVTPLMAILDRALFFGEREHCPWSEIELQQLSTLGARYKETSVLFPDWPLLGSPNTKISEDVVWILDPLNRSILTNLSEENNTAQERLNLSPRRRLTLETGSKMSSDDFSCAVKLATKASGKLPQPFLGQAKATSYTFDEVKLLMAILSNPPGWQEKLRLEFCLTHAELSQKIQWAQKQLTQYDIEPSLAFSPEDAVDSPWPVESLQTLAPFDDQEFTLRHQLESLRRCLQLAGYDLQTICQRLEIESLQAIEPTRLHYYDRHRLGQSDLDDLIRLFLLRVALPPERLQALFGPQLMQLLIQLGLLIPRGEQWSARIDLFCVDGLYVATDHRYLLLEEDSMDESPVMYIGADSQGLVYTAPRYSVERVLDLCCGSGVQGLVASRYAQQVTSVDLNPRAIRFSRFNAQLNDIRNIQFFPGSLYEPVRGQLFDTILANPPFVPSPKRDLGFRDGGATGEDILAAIIRDSAQYLKPQGHVFIVTDLVDITTYEAKLSQWWYGGNSHQLVLCTADRDDVLFSVPHSHAPFGQSLADYNAELERWLTNFHQAGLGAVNFGYILIRQQPDEQPSSYFCRTIHNPTQAIHGLVQGYFEQRDLLQSPSRDNCFLSLLPSLCFRIESGVSGIRRKHELFVPNDPYFTTYQISEDLYEILQTIQRLTPQWHRFMTPANRAQLVDLICKGLLQLSIQRPQSPDSQRLEKLLPQSSDAEGIVELRTKTTPTCLSAYLK
ncbi:carbamoyltransferase C-terminal domain-containing protein [Leptothoe sp. PORK10 BA2]|uniref:carbamoyltransferase C-terminal domain-containing protein n=1 Tax=Leptothoe sp. PORK10 BA2 TaxID=3110254 RepID=UPI002B215250|nr:carbamoyltransferase C-terminal domain-containing protein [Leptothoe sp. PORK10 BA2]MEA5462546.1 carbamoyltransferase C-terminal domain-containing protein [Leptothoe sp. PORK10 BA2]